MFPKYIKLDINQRVMWFILQRCAILTDSRTGNPLIITTNLDRRNIS